MLVLTRKKGEAIIINENIEIVLVEVDGEQIKLGINAPRDIEIHRKEIYLTIQEENKNASMQTLSKDILDKMYRK